MLAATVSRHAARVSIALACLPATASAGSKPADPTRLVNPLTGTLSSQPDFGTGGGAGNTFPGAVVPFGALAWSPDTFPSRDNHAGGYTHSDRRIEGFSLTHLSGAGCAQLRDVPFVPTSEAIHSSPARPRGRGLDRAFLARFSHARESASPGHYSVTLDPRKPRRIWVGLAAAAHSGIARIRYHDPRHANLLIDAGGSATANGVARVRIDPRHREVRGTVESGRFCGQQNSYELHFVARFDRRFARYGTWERQRLRRRSKSASESAQVNDRPARRAEAGAFIGFGARKVEARVGISFTSTAAARENLRAEVAGRRFEAVRRAAQRKWRRALRPIAVSGGERAARRTFATALYHALIHPSTISDTAGSFPRYDGRVGSDRGDSRYSHVSGWDIYRTQLPLLSMIAPRTASAVVRSLLGAAKESGALPKWPIAASHTNVMTGDPADPIIAAAWAMGARDFDLAEALARTVDGASDPLVLPGGYSQRPGLAEYQALGYVPFELNADPLTNTDSPHVLAWGSAATTLEYAAADFAVSCLAEAAGNGHLRAQFLARSANWQNALDPATGLMAPRSSSGAFVGGKPTSDRGFAEGSAAQYTWSVPHDIGGLVARLGGAAAAAARLDHFLAKLNAGIHSTRAFLGNEPTLHTPWIYNWLGAPDRAQDAIRRTRTTLYGPGPGGLPGNDDLGSLSAWYVFSALGLYPAVPGTDLLAISTPAFERAELRLTGRRLTVLAPGAGRALPYIASATLDGVPLDRPWIRLGELEPDSVLAFGLSAEPTSWGTIGSPPPDFAAGAPCSVP